VAGAEPLDLQPFLDAGLYDPASPTADQRRELLEHLVARFPVDDILLAGAQGAAYSIAAALVRPKPEGLSAREVAEQAGTSVERVATIRSASGFPVDDPDERSIPPTMVEDLALVQLASEQFGEDAVIAFTRVIASCVRRINEAARAIFSQPLADAGSTELEVSLANELAVAAYEALPSVIAHQMWEVNARDEDFVEALIAGRLDLAVVFVDLVGSTAWTAAAGPDQRRRALERFEQAAWEAATTNGGRLVKLIGDEAMVVARTPAAACRIAAQLCAAAEHDPDLPLARGGVAWGEVEARDGDYYGPTVNLAARLVDTAVASTLVVTEAVAASLDPQQWDVDPASPTALRGIATPVPICVVHPSRSPAAAR
jgi:adenylate cyclase